MIILIINIMELTIDLTIHIGLFYWETVWNIGDIKMNYRKHRTLCLFLVCLVFACLDKKKLRHKVEVLIMLGYQLQTREAMAINDNATLRYSKIMLLINLVMIGRSLEKIDLIHTN